MHHRLRIAMLGAAAWIAVALPASADLSAQAVPMKYNLTVRPGERITRDVLVSNSGTNLLVGRVRLADWDLDASGEMDLLPAGSVPQSLMGAVSFEPQEFSLPPGQSERVRITLTLPADGPATRWGVLLSELRPADTTAPRMSPRAIAQLGTTIYLSRVPAADIHPEVVGMTVQPYGGDSLQVSVRVRNTGERHFYVSGTFSLSDTTGTRLSEGSVGSGVVLPGGERKFTWTSPVAPAAGRYTATASLDTGEPELLVAEAEFAWPPPRMPLAGR